jgi:hypothetical protein
LKDDMALTAPPAGWYHHRLDPEVLRFWDGNGWTDQLRRVPTPGWYPHPEDPSRRRYWNGSAWTDDVAPTPAARIPVAATPGASTPAAPTAAAPTPPPCAPEPVAEPSEPRPGPASVREGPAEAVARLRATPVGAPEHHDDVANVEPAAQERSRRRRSPVLLGLEALVLVAVVAAGAYLVLTKSGLNLGSSSGPSTVPAPPGYHTISLPTAGMSFAVRDTWLGVDTSSQNFQQTLQQFAAANPTACGCSGTPTGLAAVTSNIKYLALDAGSTTYQPNVEVLSLGVTRDALTNVVASQDAFRHQIPNAVVAPATIAGHPRPQPLGHGGRAAAQRIARHGRRDRLRRRDVARRVLDQRRLGRRRQPRRRGPDRRPYAPPLLTLPGGAGRARTLGRG